MTRTGARRANGVTLLKWHRRVGLVAGVLVLVVAITGILLNHAAWLGLRNRVIGNEALLAWYGMGPDRRPVSYRVGDYWLTWAGQRLYFNGDEVADQVENPRGVAVLDEYVVAGTAAELLLLARDGVLVERIGEASLPGRIERMGRGENDALIVQTRDGRFRTGVAFSGWERTVEAPKWAFPAETPANIYRRVLASYRGRGLPLDRLILDLHSGRIFGPWGPYLMDAAAWCLVVLAATGGYNWFRSRRGTRTTRRPVRQPWL